MMNQTMRAPQQKDGEEVANQILTSIADEIETEILDLPPLTNSVDMESLVGVIQSEGTSKVVFSYNGYEISIDGDCQVEVLSTER